jgi:hypothetical protein
LTLSLDVKRLSLIAILVALAARDGIAQPPRVPVLVELYTSEGCSSCPPADVLLESLLRDQPIARAQIIPIGLHVDYFNDLGWKDAFSSSDFTARQRSYSPIFGDENLYTPQIVIDGHQEIAGNEGDLVRRAIESAAVRPHLTVKVAAGILADRIRLTIDVPAAPSHAERIQVIAAITEDGLSSVVTRGENSGHTLHHVAVARIVQGIDVLSATSSMLERQLPLRKGWGSTGLNAVVWLQGAKSRQIYGTTTTSITR